jgi:hypothetical protein
MFKVGYYLVLISRHELGKSNGAMVDHELDYVQELEKIANLKHYEVGSKDVDHGIEGDVGEGDVGDVVEGGAIVEEL